MKVANQHQKDENYMNLVAGKEGRNENIKDEIYRMMLFLNLIKDESLSQPNIPVISEDDKPVKEGDPFEKLREVFPKTACSN